MEFRFFDPTQKIDFARRNLPHWEQREVTYFITFRTVDSLPSEVVGRWTNARDKWLRRRGIDPRDPDWHNRLHGLRREEEDEFHDKFSAEFHRYLDAGHGECQLKRPQIAEIVSDTLCHFDGNRYQIGGFVVMPNHVHLLVQFLEGTRLGKQCYSWKRYSSGKINRALSRRGRFWQIESYDRIVRDQDEFEHYRDYIHDNPKTAGLTGGEFLYWRREEV